MKISKTIKLHASSEIIRDIGKTVFPKTQANRETQPTVIFSWFWGTGDESKRTSVAEDL